MNALRGVSPGHAPGCSCDEEADHADPRCLKGCQRCGQQQVGLTELCDKCGPHAAPKRFTVDPDSGEITILEPGPVTHRFVIGGDVPSALVEANAAAQRAGIREGETLAELISRLYAETLADDEYPDPERPDDD